MSHRIVPAALAALCLCAFVAPVPAAASGLLDHEVGIKGLVGYNHWSGPENTKAVYRGVYSQDWGFDRARGGYGGGVGLYYQLRIIKFIGLELDLLAENNRLWEHPLEGSDLKLTAETWSIRVPILVQGILPLPGVRIGIGLGPEFVIPVKQLAHVTGGTSLIDFKVNQSWTTLLTMELAFTVVLYKGLVMPIDLRASKNLMQSSEWTDRVKFTSSGLNLTGMDVNAQNSWDFRLCLGLGYGF